MRAGCVNESSHSLERLEGVYRESWSRVLTPCLHSTNVDFPLAEETESLYLKHTQNTSPRKLGQCIKVQIYDFEQRMSAPSYAEIQFVNCTKHPKFPLSPPMAINTRRTKALPIKYTASCYRALFHIQRSMSPLNQTEHQQEGFT